MEFYIAEINNYLKFIIEGFDNTNPCKEYLQYSLFPGGKRLRPLLSLITYEMYGKNLGDIIPLASSIELIHTYSLIHDDLPAMDNDDYRRSKLTLHKKYDDATAILTGDLILNLAFEIALKDLLETDSKNLVNKIRAYDYIFQASGAKGMVLGQFLDITNRLNSLEDLEYMYERKTGDLIKAAILASGILAGAQEDELQLLEKLSNSFALAFQVQDDIDDYDQDKKISKKTLISHLTKKEAMDMLRKYTMNCTDDLSVLEASYGRETSKLNLIISNVVGL